MHPLHIVYLNGPDVRRLALGNTEILDAVERGLGAQGRHAAAVESRIQRVPDAAAGGHFKVTSSVARAMGLAGVMVAGEFVGNLAIGLPSEAGTLTLFDPDTGVPLAILNANSLMHMRTGAMTALGAKYLARKASKILGHIGAGEDAQWNIRLLNHLFDFDEIRVYSPSAESLARLDALSLDLGKPVTAVQNEEACVRGADIVVEASRPRTAVQLEVEWIRPGALVIACGAPSGAPLLESAVDRVVVDDRGQCVSGGETGPDLGEIIAHSRPGRIDDEEIILYRQYGLALADVALASEVLDKAGAMSIGQTLRWE